MESLILSLGLCSAVMTLVSLLYWVICRFWGSRWSAKWRYYLWFIPITGFLTPMKPQLFHQPVVTLQLPAPAAVSSSAQSAASWTLLALWGLGFLSFWIILGVRHHRFMKTISRFGYPPSDTQTAALETLAHTMGLKAPPAVIVPGLGSPMVAGLFRPLLLLPRRTYEPTALSLILRHELTHLKRRDLWLKLPVLAVRSLHWFNPLMTRISHAVDHACELACDEAMMADQPPQLRKLYCLCILDTVDCRRSHQNTPLVSTGLGCDKGQLKQRLLMIFSAGQRKKHALLAAVCLLGITLLTGALFSISGASAHADSPTQVTAFRRTEPQSPSVAGDNHPLDEISTTIVIVSGTDETPITTETSNIPENDGEGVMTTTVSIP
jgi:beta-lactamase regulating signal transducer with metallopeptidase domain